MDGGKRADGGGDEDVDTEGAPLPTSS
jgi:hypothetical protein